MWLLSTFKTIHLKQTIFKSIIIHYTNSFYYITNHHIQKKTKQFNYVWPYFNKNILLKLGGVYKIVKFFAVGKAYRITKHKKILHINMHYPTFKYIIWNNIKLKYFKKKKKLYKLRYCTNTHIRSNLFTNLFYIRIPNTYTKRGILNNISIYYNRKQKMATRR